MEVAIHVYDISPNNDSLYPWGLGFYHSGVVIGGQEYTFSQSGVFSHPPRGISQSDAKFREMIRMGTFNGTSSDVQRIIDDLKQDFLGPDYHIMNKNCNSFADAFVRKLIGKPLPSYINRMANIGSYFSCLINPMIAAAQNNAQNNNNNTQGSNKMQSNGYAPVSTGNNKNQISTFAAFSGPARKLGN